MAAVLAARRRLAPTVDVSHLEQPGTHGAAQFAAWAAGPGAEPRIDRRPPPEWFTRGEQLGRTPSGRTGSSRLTRH
jgi:hypothetical protein